jgi:site-specific recombinase XerD
MHARGLAHSTIASRSSSLSDLFRYSDATNPTKNKLMAGVLEAIKRNSLPPAKKNPATARDFVDLARKVDKTSFLDVRNHLMFCLMFKGMLRASSAAGLPANCIWIEIVDGEEVLFVFLESSKTDQYRLGTTILIGKGQEESSCPLYWYKLYASLKDPNEKAFFHMAPEARRQSNTFMAPGTINTLFKKKLKAAGIQTYLTSHSLRAGGVTAALRAGVDLRLVKHHGKWKSDAVLVYITESIANQLSVSKAF